MERQLKHKSTRKRVKSVRWDKNGAEEKFKTSSTPSTSEDAATMEVGGIETASGVEGNLSTPATPPKHKQDNSLHSNALQSGIQSVKNQICAFSEHGNNTMLHKKCALYVRWDSVPDDLVEIVNAWGGLPDLVKAGIRAMIRATR